MLAVDALALPAGRAVRRVSGELDLASCSRLRDALNAELAAGRTWLVLDMTDLAFLDSTGMSVLVEFSKKTSRAAGSWRWPGCSRSRRECSRSLAWTAGFRFTRLRAPLSPRWRRLRARIPRERVRPRLVT